MLSPVENPPNMQKIGGNRNRRKRHVKGCPETIPTEIGEKSQGMEGFTGGGWGNKKPAMCIAGSHVEAAFIAKRGANTPLLAA
jgi:hypothetical protein